MSASPNFASTITTGACVISVANTSLTGTGTTVTGFTAGSNGAYITDINIKALTDTTAGMVRIFLVSGSTYYLIKEVAITAITKSASVPAFETTIVLNQAIASGMLIKFAPEKAETFSIITYAGAY